MGQRMPLVMLTGIVWGWLAVSGVQAANNPCQEGLEVLGLSLQAAVREQGAEARGLVVVEVDPYSHGARIGLRRGDVIEQANSWRTPDCHSYSRAVQDARAKQQALLLLVARRGRRETLSFEAQVWQRKEKEQQAKAATESLRTMLAKPLPANVQGQIDQTGVQALAVLRDVAAVSVLYGNRPGTYESGVRNARTQLRALDQASQGEAQKRVVAGANTVLDYYVTAEEILQHKQEYVDYLRNNQHRERQVEAGTLMVPYHIDSPVTSWLNKYPFLQASVSKPAETAKLFTVSGSWAGQWNPDDAVQLLWQRAQRETDLFERWLQQNARPQGSAGQ